MGNNIDWYAEASRCLTDWNGETVELPYTEGDSSAVTTATGAQALATLALVDAVRELAATIERAK